MPGIVRDKEFWRQQNAAYEAQDQTQLAYCAAQGLSAKTFARWRGVFKREHGTCPKQTAPKPDASLVTGPAQFIPVQVVDSVNQKRVETAALRGSSSGVSLLVGAVRVDVAIGFDAATLDAVLAALEAL